MSVYIYFSKQDQRSLLRLFPTTLFSDTYGEIVIWYWNYWFCYFLHDFWVFWYHAIKEVLWCNRPHPCWCNWPLFPFLRPKTLLSPGCLLVVHATSSGKAVHTRPSPASSNPTKPNRIEPPLSKARLKPIYLIYIIYIYINI